MLIEDRPTDGILTKLYHESRWSQRFDLIIFLVQAVRIYYRHQDKYNGGDEK